MSLFTFKMPFTNPFPMFRMSNGQRVYLPFRDKELGAQGRRYTQVWGEDDRLSFQCSWYNITKINSYTLSVSIEVNGYVKRTWSFGLSTNGVQGTQYTCFVVQKNNQGGMYRNGMFAFSQKISDIKNAEGTQRILNEGDCFRVLITDPSGTVWESDPMEVVADTGGTKLIHYNNTSEAEERIFDTYFGYMVYGYDLRLHGYFSDFTPSSDMEVFQSSDGGVEMISAVPRWSYTMHLGLDGVGLPLHFVRLMNAVACCDQKSVEGFGDFEFTNGEGFGNETFADYTNGFWTAEISARDNDIADSVTSENKLTNVFPVVHYDKPDVVIIGFDVEAVGVGKWHVGSLTVQQFKTIDRLKGGEGRTQITAVFTSPTSDTEVSFVILDENDETLYTGTVLVRGRSSKGLNYMKLGETFIVSGQRTDQRI